MIRGFRLVVAVGLVAVAEAGFVSPAAAGAHASIVFPRGTSSLYRMSADGSDIRRMAVVPWLTLAGRRTPGGGLEDVGDLAWSRQGRALAFSGHASDTVALNVYVPATGIQKTLVHVGGGTSVASPTWAPDGEHLAYSKFEPPNRSMIWVRTLGTNQVRRLTLPAAGESDGDPAWSPDGRVICFTRSRRGSDPQLYLVGRDGRGLTRLAKGSEPSWSPDGQRIAFVWGNGIYITDRQGRRTRFARIPDVQSPQWSPDERQILYYTNDAIWVMSIDGNTHTRLVYAPTWPPQPDEFPDISPGTWQPG